MSESTHEVRGDGISSVQRVLQHWRQQVDAIPSTLERLAFLAGLRNSDTRRYTHYRLTPLLGEDVADRAIRETHNETFAEWLTYNLEKQRADLELFLSSVEGHRRQILAACAILAPHSWYIPDGVPEHERRLYMADLEAILEPLYIEYGITAGASERKPIFVPQGLAAAKRRQ